MSIMHRHARRVITSSTLRQTHVAPIQLTHSLTSSSSCPSSSLRRSLHTTPPHHSRHDTSQQKRKNNPKPTIIQPPAPSTLLKAVPHVVPPPANPSSSATAATSPAAASAQPSSSSPSSPSTSTLIPSTFTWYSLSIYRYPPAFFPSSYVGLVRDARLHLFVPSSPLMQDRPPIAPGSVLAQNQEETFTEAISFAKPSSHEDSAAPPKQSKQMLVKIVKYSRPASDTSSITSSTSAFVVSLDDSISLLTSSLSSLLAPHIRITGLSLDQRHALIRRLIPNATTKEQRSTTQPDGTIRTLLAKGPLHVEYQLIDGVTVNEKGEFSRSGSPTVSSSTSAAVSSPSSSLPSLTFNSSLPLLPGEISYLRKHSRFIALGVLAIAAIVSAGYFEYDPKKEAKQRQFVDRMSAKWEKEKAQKQAKKDAIAKAMDEEQKEKEEQRKIKEQQEGQTTQS